MTGKILLSTAYLPPIEYFSYIIKAEEVFIEREENYLKQSYRSRCYILSAGGPQLLIIPVCKGSFHKTPVKEIRIDYSKRWQQIHLRALSSSYESSPYFIYYYEIIEKIIQSNYEFLLDLNMDLLKAILKMMKIDIPLSYTSDFQAIDVSNNDLRYKISPKRKSYYRPKKYIQVFDYGAGFAAGLSIMDLVFNMGPEAYKYL